MTPLDRPLRREITIDGNAYTVTLDPFGLKLTRKAHRNGVELRWADLLHGDSGAAAGAETAQPSNSTSV